eukprot:UN24273
MCVYGFLHDRNFCVCRIICTGLTNEIEAKLKVLKILLTLKTIS